MKRLFFCLTAVAGRAVEYYSDEFYQNMYDQAYSSALTEYEGYQGDYYGNHQKDYAYPVDNVGLQVGESEDVTESSENTQPSPVQQQQSHRMASVSSDSQQIAETLEEVQKTLDAIQKPVETIADPNNPPLYKTTSVKNAPLDETSENLKNLLTDFKSRVENGENLQDDSNLKDLLVNLKDQYDGDQKLTGSTSMINQLSLSDHYNVLKDYLQKSDDLSKMTLTRNGGETQENSENQPDSSRTVSTAESNTSNSTSISSTETEEVTSAAPSVSQPESSPETSSIIIDIVEEEMEDAPVYDSSSMQQVHFINELPQPTPYQNLNDPNYQPDKFTGNLNSIAKMTQDFISHYKFNNDLSKINSHQAIQGLNCYGCWCNRYENFGKSKGQPVDNYDKICRSHTHAYECMEIDGLEDRNENCQANEVQNTGYEYHFDIIHAPDGSFNMRIKCSTGQSWCLQRVCEADIQYVKDFTDLSLSGEKLDFTAYRQEGHGGTFDWENNCKVETIKHMPYKKCCGKYPKRKMFKTDVLDTSGGYRQCCDIEEGDNSGSTNGRVYLPDTQVCCGSFGVQNGDTCEYYA